MVVLRKIFRKLKYYYNILSNKVLFRKAIRNIKKYKDAYKGKRCFIIGNGPSLNVEDLEMLKNEVTMASHGIYYIYDKTEWRPTFYCAQDAVLINERIDNIVSNCDQSEMFFGLVENYKYSKKIKKYNGIRLIIDGAYSSVKEPKFSSDPIKGFYEGMTVTYFNIQLAAYMGFKEIYLLGVDHFYSGDENDHFSADDKCTNKPQTDKSTLAYISAKKHADENGMKIYNATRGGHLEVFDRVDFDSLF